MSTSAAVPPAVADRAVSSVEGESFAEPRLARPPSLSTQRGGWLDALQLVSARPGITRTLTLTKKHHPYHYHNLTLTKKHHPSH
ncbi:unnamed protein product [Boreogadus saida]